MSALGPSWWALLGLLVVACEAGPAGPAVVVPHIEPTSTSPTMASEPEPVVVRPAWRDGDGALVRAEHWLPGPARLDDPPRDPAARHLADGACQRCHHAIAHDWLGSQHAGSWSSPAFQRAFASEPRAFCQRCHAPEERASTAVGEVTEPAASLGVGCVTCHVQPGTTEVWAAPRAGAHQPDRPAPHPIARSPAFAGPQACARCHEFPFPDHALRDHPLAMQSTVTEHGRSAFAALSCADCHMPRDADGRRSHGFPGAYDGAMLAQALEIDAARPTPSTIRIRLAPGRVGHAVPTGDLLRRLELRVQVDGEDEPAFTATKLFGRRFGQAYQSSGVIVRDELADDRVGTGPDAGVHVATFTLPAPLAGSPVRWQVLHQRVAAMSRDPWRAPIEGQVQVAAGLLVP
ncbi:multiheme c-type cytochrome [Paraliomyxa miuraensis]|uniref:multiheme c-type cytochrome n=1 Tax=Paraliomyxa miuraensis TaxID=376150 RepID=UPI002259A9BA|nr:multiheme c-type cytochrome [Paraliomyxa miuraensis]MCX4240794.1 cytochrome c family protein [Paraliomyxa miuraensis]